ncbi:hypothetical protein [Leptolyngbya sp. FACHB-8]|nr:hypothetical protein [Leptolyngbya sp. FACHB-8]
MGLLQPIFLADWMLKKLNQGGRGGFSKTIAPWLFSWQNPPFSDL